MSERTMLAHMDKFMSGIRARATFSHSEWEIEHGHSYTVEVDNETLGDGDSFAFGFKTPPVNKIHLLTSFATKAQTVINLIENADWSGGQTGTQKNVYNRCRNSPNQIGLLTDWNISGSWQASGNVHFGMSGLQGGTIIHHDHTYATKQAGAELRGQDEFVLKTGTIYAVQFLSEAATNGGSLTLDFHEEIEDN